MIVHSKAILLMSIVSLGIIPLVEAQDYSIKNFSVEDGLPHSRVVKLHEDRKGYLWIGTYGGGVARFDGRQFESFDESNGLINSVVLGIQVDSKGHTWICTPLGISKFDGTTFISIRGHFERGFFGMDVLEHHDTIYSVLKAKNDWRFGIIYGDSIVGSGYTFRQKEPIVNVFAADNNTLYINLANGDIIKKTDGLVKLASGMHVITFFKSRWGVHALTDEGIVDLKDAGILERYSDLKADWITIDNDFSTGWVLNGGQLKKYSFSDSTWKIEDLVPPFESAVTLIDSEGNSWFGTIGKGLYRISRGSFTKLNDDQASVYSFAKDQQSNVWVGTQQGIDIYDVEYKLKHQLKFGNDERNSVTSLVTENSGSIWAGTLGGIAHFDPARKLTWYTEEDGLNSNAIRALETDMAGHLWVAYNQGKGLSIIDEEGIKNITEEDGLLVESVWDLKYHPGMKTMLVCTDLGVQKFVNGKFQLLNIPEFKNKILLSLGLYKSDYALIGSGGAGLAIYNLLTDEYKILTTRDGIASNFIYFSDSYETDPIWVGTVKGIDNLSLDEKLNVKGLVHFDSQSGISSNGVNTNSIFLDANSQIFGMTEGAYRYIPTNPSENGTFPLHFVQIRTKPGYINPELRDVVFESDQTEFEFNFNKVDKQGSISRYEYKLENWDKDWIRISGNHPVVFGKLLPGEYTFRVRAANPEGLWLEEINFPFKIRTPVYQQFWFRFFLVISLVVLVFVVVYTRARMRVHQLMLAEKARNDESLKLRKEIGSDFHDEVGNQLARIINYIGLLKMSTYPNKGEVLQKMEETSKYLLTGTKDFLWSIDPIHDNLDSVCIHIRDFGEKLMIEKGIEFRYYSDAHTRVKLPFGYTRQINLIFKEAITNAFKHSGAKRVNFKIHQNQKSTIMILEDDGKGLGEFAVGLGDGFKNMRTRAGKINSDLFIEGSEAGGTVIKLALTLNT
ncbi:MAG: two-component regulator propeller domain-containing protein [Cyclobacteriaceae bacterium]